MIMLLVGVTLGCVGIFWGNFWCFFFLFFWIWLDFHCILCANSKNKKLFVVFTPKPSQIITVYCFELNAKSRRQNNLKFRNFKKKNWRLSKFLNNLHKIVQKWTIFNFFFFLKFMNFDLSYLQYFGFSLKYWKFMFLWGFGAKNLKICPKFLSNLHEDCSHIVHKIVHLLQKFFCVEKHHKLFTNKISTKNNEYLNPLNKCPLFFGPKLKPKKKPDIC